MANIHGLALAVLNFQVFFDDMAAHDFSDIEICGLSVGQGF